MSRLDWKQEDERNTLLYSGLLATHGPGDVRSLDWGSKAGQQLRFRVLSEIGVAAADSLLDVGCGTGDLHEWLDEHRPGVRYTGLDITPEMLEVCRTRFPSSRFERANLLEPETMVGEQFDWVVASGIFAKRPAAGQSYLEAMVARMFSLARTGVAFNSLSSWCADQDPGEFYSDPLQTLTFCRTLTPWVALRHDYHARDFTLYLTRDRRA